jgi:hypothetical protein
MPRMRRRRAPAPGLRGPRQPPRNRLRREQGSGTNKLSRRQRGRASSRAEAFKERWDCHRQRAGSPQTEASTPANPALSLTRLRCRSPGASYQRRAGVRIRDRIQRRPRGAATSAFRGKRSSGSRRIGRALACGFAQIRARRRSKARVRHGTSSPAGRLCRGASATATAGATLREGPEDPASACGMSRGPLVSNKVSEPSRSPASAKAQATGLDRRVGLGTG